MSSYNHNRPAAQFHLGGGGYRDILLRSVGQEVTAALITQDETGQCKAEQDKARHDNIERCEKKKSRRNKVKAKQSETRHCMIKRAQGHTSHDIKGEGDLAIQDTAREDKTSCDHLATAGTIEKK